MDPLAIALLTCSLYADDALVSALAETSLGNPWLVLSSQVDIDEPTEAAPSRDASEARMNALLAEGDDPLIGPMHVPASWAARFARAADDLLDPCTNISVATATLSEFAYECALPGPLAASRACVLTRYAQAIHLPELARVLSLALAAKSPKAARSPFDSPIFPAGNAQSSPRGASCIFVQRGGPRTALTDEVPDPFLAPTPPSKASTSQTSR